MPESMTMTLLFVFYVFIIMEYLGTIKLTVKSKINKALGICSLKEEGPASALALFLPPQADVVSKAGMRNVHSYLDAAFPPQHTSSYSICPNSPKLMP